MCCKCGGGSTGSVESDAFGDMEELFPCETECECGLMDDACWDACIECLDLYD